MIVIHYDQPQGVGSGIPGTIHEIQPGTINDVDISDTANIQQSKIVNLNQAAFVQHRDLTDVTSDQHHTRSHDHTTPDPLVGALAFGIPGSSAPGDV